MMTTVEITITATDRYTQVTWTAMNTGGNETTAVQTITVTP